MNILSPHGRETLFSPTIHLGRAHWEARRTQQRTFQFVLREDAWELTPPSPGAVVEETSVLVVILLHSVWKDNTAAIQFATMKDQEAYATWAARQP